MALCVSKLNIVAYLHGGEHNHIISDVSFSVERGKKLAIVGRSGCGKTMTAMAILGLLPENCEAHGSILWEGEELTKISAKRRRELLGRELIYIPQSGADFLNPSVRIEKQMDEALCHAGVPKAERAGKMRELLGKTGLEDIERIIKSYPFQLSGGMAQRVVMAMGSCGEPGLVIADEPTRGIDKENTALFLKNLDAMFSSSAVLLITHDISAASSCDEMLVMKDGKVIEQGTSFQILHEPENEYTHMLICDLPHALDHARKELL